MPQPIVWKGRGAVNNPQGRFEKLGRVADEEAYWLGEDNPPPTEVRRIRSRSIVTRNDSPDITYGQSINPYQGCEHGCIYCYARPSHAYLDLSPGLDFERKLFAKTNAAELLRAELSRKSYVCSPIVIGSNTDPYQPIERELRITRSLLEVAAEFKQPVGIISKSALVERDLDILGPMAAEGLVRVMISITTLDGELARKMEPRAAAPYRRVKALKALADAGVPCGVMTAPMIPFVNDCDMEAILEATREAGADVAGYVLLRLPYELKEVFRGWLKEHFPLRAEHVMARMQDMRGGKDYNAEWGRRQRGEGHYAELLRQRFAKGCARLGFNQSRKELDTHKFCVPGRAEQLGLF